MIKAAPRDWTAPLEAITMRNGDCKSYSIAKYAAARAADHLEHVGGGGLLLERLAQLVRRRVFSMAMMA